MEHIESLDWKAIYGNINERGFSHVKGLVSHDFCENFISLYKQSDLYRNVIDMKRYRFGMGEYKYFSYPLPVDLQSLREKMYEKLVPIANDWSQKLELNVLYPAQHGEFIATCAANAQLRPTPLILNYHAGGFNTLHQDLYGDVYFPFQIVIMLTEAGKDFTGGEFVMTEQVPRAQSRAQVIPAAKGDAVIFTTNFRPAQGARGYYRAAMRHGVSEILSGERYSLGVIFHDAK